MTPASADAPHSLMPSTDEGFLALFAHHVGATPQRVFARIGSRTLTFQDLDERSRRLAAWLVARGVRPSDRIALMLRNGDTTLALMFAVARMGAVWVPINTQAVGDNLAYVLTHAEPRVVIAEPDLLAVISGCGAVLASAIVIAAGPAESEAAGFVAKDETPTVLASADAPFAIMYTSGTTGRPKGVIVSHRMLRLAGEGAAMVSAALDGDVMYIWEPLFHIGGAQMIVLPLIRDVVLVIAERFSASRLWADLSACGATHLHFLGGILQMLLKQPPQSDDRVHRVRIAWGGGCPREVWQPFEARFGVQIRECYGMTECSSFTTANFDGTIGSVGKPMPWFEVDLLDESGRTVPTGARGEIVVRERIEGALAQGYFKDKAATAAAFRNGAFRTGDLGSCDAAGNFYFHGRMSDSVRVRGENVTAAEVEDVARQHPAIADCAMIGVQAEVGEAEIKLFVKLKPDAELSPQELSLWLAPRLARYQRPRYVSIVEDFERTPNQRIMKHKLSKHIDDAWDSMRK